MWIELSSAEQLEFISKASGVNAIQIDLTITALVEQRLSREQRERYVDYMSGCIADLTYRTVDPSSHEAANAYYFNMLTANADIRARMLWHAIKGIQP